MGMRGCLPSCFAPGAPSIQPESQELDTHAHVKPVKRPNENEGEGFKEPSTGPVVGPDVGPRRPQRRPSVLAAMTEDVTSKYTSHKCIGSGAYSDVISCTEQATGNWFACKTIPVQKLLGTPDGPNVISRMRNEIAILAHLAGHPNIVRIHDVYESDTRLFIVQELCRGTLSDLVKAMAPVSEARAAVLFRGMLKPVVHCHQMGVLHRDVKLENFLVGNLVGNLQSGNQTILNSNSIKLADFGLACFFQRDQRVTEAVGTPFYMAPESVKRGGKGYGPEVDVWACGVCLYEMLSGQVPFDGKSSHDVFTALRGREDADFSNEMWRAISSDAIDLVRRLLRKDPGVRITAHDALAHPWMARLAPGTAGRSSGTPSGQRTSSESARVFVPPADHASRAAVLDFIDTFRAAEDAYIQLLEASDAQAAAEAWEAMRDGLAALDADLRSHAHPSGPYFKGAAPCLAEAATAPSLRRMRATMPAVRGLHLVSTCEGMGLERAARWIDHVLSHPVACCDVAILTDDQHVRLARRILVTYDGPPASNNQDQQKGVVVNSKSKPPTPNKRDAKKK